MLKFQLGYQVTYLVLDIEWLALLLGYDELEHKNYLRWKFNIDGKLSFGERCHLGNNHQSFDSRTYSKTLDRTVYVCH